MDNLTEKLAEKMWIIESADMMITVQEAARRWAKHKEQRSQRYLAGIYTARTALAALKNLGIEIPSSSIVHETDAAGIPG